MTVPKIFAALLLLAASVRSAEVSNFCATVEEEGYRCATCGQPVYCSGGSTFVFDPCELGRVCQEVADSSLCLIISNTTKCGCNRNQCDPYNPDYLDYCNEDGIYDVVLCSGDLYADDCTESKCGDFAPANSCQDGQAIIPGWNTIIPSCTSGFYCCADGTQIDKECAATEYLDENGNCQPAPPQPCASCTGTCPDPLNCTRFYYCLDDGSVDGPEDCTDGLFFDPSAAECQVDENLCSPLTKCEFSAEVTSDPTISTILVATTTTVITPRSSSRVPPSAPCTEDTTGVHVHGLCSSYYWSCHDTGDGNWQYVQLECLDGQVFNPDRLYCDDLADVAACSTAALHAPLFSARHVKSEAESGVEIDVDAICTTLSRAGKSRFSFENFMQKILA